MSNCDSLIKNVIVHQIISIILINIQILETLQIMYPTLHVVFFSAPSLIYQNFGGTTWKTILFPWRFRAQMTKIPLQKRKKTSSLTGFRQEMMTVIASGQGWGYLTMSSPLLSCVLRSCMRVPIH